MTNLLIWLAQFTSEILAVFVAIELSNRWTVHQEKKNKLILTCSRCEKPLKLMKVKKSNLDLCYKCIRVYRTQQKALKSQELAEQADTEN